MRLRNICKPARKYILYFALAVYVLEQVLFFSDIFPFSVGTEKVLKLIYVLTIAVVFLLQDYSPKLYLAYGLLGTACVLTRLGSGLMFWVYSVITILALRQEDISDVFRFLRWCLTISLLILALAFAVKYFQGQRQFIEIDNVGRRRVRLGFLHANSLSTYFFNLMLLWVWEKYESIGPRAIAGLLLTTVAMYLLTDSRTAFLCEMLLCLMIVLAKYGGKAAGLLHFGARWAAPAAAVFMLACSVMWLAPTRSPFVVKVNRLLSGRVYLSAYAVKHFGFTLFGQSMPLDPVTVSPEWPIPFFTLDCAYSFFCCCIGAIWLILICVSFYKLAKLRNPRISIFLILWALYSVSESLTLYVCFFSPLLLISILFRPSLAEAALTDQRQPDEPM